MKCKQRKWEKKKKNQEKARFTYRASQAASLHRCVQRTIYSSVNGLCVSVHVSRLKVENYISVEFSIFTSCPYSDETCSLLAYIKYIANVGWQYIVCPCNTYLLLYIRFSLSSRILSHTSFDIFEFDADADADINSVSVVVLVFTQQAKKSTRLFPSLSFVIVFLTLKRSSHLRHLS